MSSPCIPEAGFFDSPEFLSFALHFTTSISTPIHILGLYFLLFKTPDYMKTVRWYMVNLHTWIILFDYSVGILTVPIVLLPSFAGYSFGVLTKFNVPILYQALLVLNFLGYVQISIMAIFENRFHTICDYIGKEYWKWLRYPWLATHYFGVSGVLLSFGYLTPDQSFAIETVLKRLPCLPENFYDIPIFVLAEDHTYHLITFIFFVCSTSFEIVAFVSIIIYNSLKRKSMSKKTYQMQRTLFLAILLQMAIPAVTLIIPFIYAGIAVLKSYHNQAITNLSVVTASLHGCTSTIVMLLVHRPYREGLLFIFTRSSKSVFPSKTPCNRKVIQLD